MKIIKANAVIFSIIFTFKNTIFTLIKQFSWDLRRSSKYGAQETFLKMKIGSEKTILRRNKFLIQSTKKSNMEE